MLYTYYVLTIKLEKTQEYIYSMVIFIEKSTYNWTHAVQTFVAQGSTVVSNCSLFNLHVYSKAEYSQLE